MRIAKKKSCDNMKNMFHKKMEIMYGRTLKFQASMTSPLGVDERYVNIGKFLPKVVKSKMMRIYGCRFRMKLLRENEGNDLTMAVSLSVQGSTKAAMEGGMSQDDLEKLVGNVIRGIYEKDDESASNPAMLPLPPTLPATSTGPLFAVAKVYGTPKDGTPQERMGLMRKSRSA